MSQQYLYPGLSTTMTWPPPQPVVAPVAQRPQGDGMDKETLMRQEAGPLESPWSAITTATSRHSILSHRPVHVALSNPAKCFPVDVLTGTEPASVSHDVEVSTATRGARPDQGSTKTAPTEEMIKHIMSRDCNLTVEDSEADRVRLSKKRDVDSTIVTLTDEQLPETVGSDLWGVESRLKHLEQELEVQTKINTDLKKLLVASMGDDLHYKVETLVRTKARLATEINDYTQKMSEDYENLDQVSIQADMWRSKFMASRLLSEQLGSEREMLTERLESSLGALRQLLQERQQVYDTSLETHRYLKLLWDGLQPPTAFKAPTPITDLMALAASNRCMADDVRRRLVGLLPVFPAALDAGIQNGLTPAEKLACQLLSEDGERRDRAERAVNVAPPGHKRVNRVSRFHTHVRYDGLTLNCCKNCSGDIHVV